MATSERIRVMKEGFMLLHEEGKTIPEIAKHFHVTTMTIYNNLQEIADSNGVSRESLLSQVHKKHEIQNPRSSKSQEMIDTKKLLEDFEEVSTKVDNIIAEIDNILEKQEDEEDGNEY